MANIGYSLDTVGNNPLNRVSETRTLNKKVLDGRAFVIPKATPFFAEGVEVWKDGKLLVKGHDYHLILKSEELSQVCERDIRAGILFNTVALTDTVTFIVQTVGGEFNVPIGNTIENMVRVIRNPVFTTWSELVGTPIGLPTWDHNEDWGSTVGYSEFIAALDRLQLAMTLNSTGGGNDGTALALIQNHLISPSGHTKNQVGLGNVQNYVIAQDADYVKPPYPNNKYVTPRSVMYAIDLFIGTKLTNQDTKITDLETILEENTLAYQNLMNSWNDLQQTLDSVSTNYDKMTLAVNGYSQSLATFEAEYKAINDNQKEWIAKLSEFNKTLIEYGKDYNAVIETQQKLLDDFAKLALTNTELTSKYQTVIDTNDVLAKRIEGIEKHTVYPVIKAVTSGSFHFKIKPNEKFLITLIGGGGGSSELVEDAVAVPYYRGENGGSTSLWCLQDMITGEVSPSVSPIAIAGGGFGSEATHGSPTAIIRHGLGGRGGAFKVKTGITVDEASNGEGGIKGYGDFKPNIISKQDTGYDYFGSKWGKASNVEDALGQGGEGAIVKIQIGNTTTKELEFMIKVGEAGRSHNPDKSNATGGLALINKIV